MKEEGTGKVYQTTPDPVSRSNGPETDSGIEWLPGFPENVAEPFAGIVPAIGHQRLVHMPMVKKTPADGYPRERSPGSPPPFTLADGRSVTHLPPCGAPTISAADISQVVADHPEFRFVAAIEQFGIDEFVLQAERARAFLRGRRFWAKRRSRRGLSAYGLKHEAEKNGGVHVGYVSELA
jgi:hypothetical protein